MRTAAIIQILLVLHVIGWLPAVGMAETPSVEDITSTLKCQCGCTMIVAECNCEEAAKITSEVRTLVQQGNSRKEVISELKSRYGREILATPEKSGFDLSLWILPGIGVITGGLLIYLIISRNKMSEEDVFEMEYQEFLEAQSLQSLHTEAGDETQE